MVLTQGKKDWLVHINSGSKKMGISEGGEKNKFHQHDFALDLKGNQHNVTTVKGQREG